MIKGWITRRQGSIVPDPISPWRSLAAYLYVLRLNSSSLAWEYLRRNGAYREDWQQFGSLNPESARQCGLSVMENPALDARDAQPMWIANPPSTVRLTAEGEPRAGTGFLRSDGAESENLAFGTLGDDDDFLAHRNPLCESVDALSGDSRGSPTVNNVGGVRLSSRASHGQAMCNEDTGCILGATGPESESSH
jgi:Family of unknown function (DUF6499)